MQVLHCKRKNLGCSSAEGRSPPRAQEPRLQFYYGFNKSGSFPLLSAPHSLFSIWTGLKRSEKIPGASTRRWGECIWLTGPSGLHRNSPQGLNISCMRVFDQIRNRNQTILEYMRFYGASTPEDIGSRNEYLFYDYNGRWYPGIYGAFVLKLRKNTGRNLNQENWPDRDRTRDR